MLSKFIFFLSFVIAAIYTYGQHYLLGTYEANDNHEGAVFSIDAATKTTKPIIELKRESTGFGFYGSFIETNANVFYGALYFGGKNNSGTIVRIDNNTIEAVYSFDTATGRRPVGKLTAIGNNEFIGIAIIGGMYGSGVIYKFNYKTEAYTILYHFANNTLDGRSPNGTYTFDKSSSILYGLTSQGGINDKGVIFSFDVKKLSYKKLYDIDIQNATTESSLTLINEKLIGTYSNTGVNKKGVIFSLDLGTNAYSVIKNADSLTGYLIGTPLIEDSIFYSYSSPGSSSVDFANIIRLNLNTGFFSLFQIPYTTGATVSSRTAPEISKLNDSTLLCIGESFGKYGGGSIFTLDIKTKKLNVLHSFSAITNNQPTKILYSKLSNKYLVLNSNGGSGGSGGIVLFDSTFSILTSLDFEKLPYGRDIGGTLIEGKDKKLYVLTNKGGARNKGTVIEIQYPTLEYKVVFDFGSKIVIRDTFPRAPLTSSLTRVSDTLLAFVTRSGGTNEEGVLALFSTNTNEIVQYASFKNLPNILVGKLSFSNGKLYGWKGFQSGEYYGNILYEYNIATNEIKDLIDFSTLNEPTRSVGDNIVSKNNKLYLLVNTFNSMSDKFDAILEYDVNTKTSKYYTISLFEGGYDHFGGLVEIANGKLAFLTYSDNSFRYGKLGFFSLNTKQFEWYDIQGSAFGASPVGTPTYVPHENALYFFCSALGNNNKGTLQRFDLVTNTFEKVADLGGGSYYTPFERLSKDVTFINSFPLSVKPNENKETLEYVTLYPNPVTQDRITIQNNSTKSFVATVYNLSGKVLSNDIKLNRRVTNIETSTFGKGVFIIKLCNQNEVLHKKFIIK